ncbi:hypothetical protein [Flexivirga caeni]|uniref:DUF3558 domain-containing protein n=1 Tax=Flexivirga caeni TaxID=2294115 RepID=A0A3M9MDD2_9MICO|nr:hypothetical protein [Flexivirga caeni]RNI23215.1 hypothetical protein EFY87_07205 [Flexivirga caeni]
MGTARATVAACAVLTAGLLAGCSGSSGGTKAAPPWSSGAPTPEGLVAGPAPVSANVVPGDTWSFTLAKTDDPNVPTSQWPSADTVLTAEQLKAAIPGARAATLGSCTKGASGTAKTAKNASCSWSIALKGDTGFTNSITVSLIAIGADKTGSGVTAAWTSVRDKDVKNRASIDRYFTQGSFGAKGSYYLGNNHASVLVSDGNIAAWINLTFIGFNSLNSSSTTLMTSVFPVLAHDLADHLPRKYA